MIFDAILRVFFGVFTGLFALIPTFSLPDELTNMGTSFGGFLAGLDGLFPIVTLMACVTWLITVRLAMFVFDAWIFFYRLIPGKGS